jgi:hypothetical protein
MELWIESFVALSVLAFWNAGKRGTGRSIEATRWESERNADSTEDKLVVRLGVLWESWEARQSPTFSH